MLVALPYAHFFIRITYFSLSLNILNFFGFEPWIILELLFNINGVATSENQMIIFKSLLMSYLIIKQNINGAE